MRELERQLGEADSIPAGSDVRKGGFTSFVFFVEEEGETRDGRKFVHSFISSDDGETWDGAYLKVKEITDIRSCKDANIL